MSARQNLLSRTKAYMEDLHQDKVDLSIAHDEGVVSDDAYEQQGKWLDEELQETEEFFTGTVNNGFEEGG